MNIQLSKANCSECSLLKSKSLIAKTNCEADLSKVDIIFVVDYFHKMDFEKNEIMSALHNKMFNELYKTTKLNKQKYLISSLILCDLKEFEDDEENDKKNEHIAKVSRECKENLFELVRTCNPKLIVGFGLHVAEAFGITEKNIGGITGIRGNVYEWEKYKIFMTFDIPFVERNVNYNRIMKSDFNKIYELVTGEKKNMGNSTSIKIVGNGMQYYSIPNKFYTNEYRLVNIQYLYNTSEILYIFRDKDNKKEYYRHNDDYYFYQCKDGIDQRKIVDMNDVIAYKVNWKNKKEIDPDTSYEGDIRIPIKHSIDYHLKNSDELLTQNLNNFYCDIEIDLEGDKTFSSPHESKHPICMISSYFDGKMIVHVLDNGKVGEIKKEVDGAELRIFKNERMMMMDFINLLKSCDPDSISGWNFKNFDMLYIYNRLPKLDITAKSVSKFGIFSVDDKYGRVDLPGIHCFCQLELYKEFTFGTKSSYKLDNIAQAEIGEKKIELPYSIVDIYYKDVNMFIEYNIQDTMLLVKLEEKLGHIALASEIKTVCSSTLDGVQSTFGQVDPLVISYMKKKNKIVKSANYHIKKEKLVGAFVKQPVAGIYEMFTDFDFTSLYPSIIRTYNIGVETFLMRFVDSHLGYDMIYNQDELPDQIEMIMDPLYENKNIVMNKKQLIEMTEKDKLICTINGCFYMNHSEKISELSEIVEYLLSSRKNYKNKMFDAKVDKDKILTNFYNTKQLVYKVIANSLYGVIANNVFRFFNNASAGAITASGQEAIKSSIVYADAKMKSMCDEQEYEVPKLLTKQEIYGDEMPHRPTPYIITSDTDSIFCCFEDFENAKDLKNIRKWCDEIQNFLNNDVIAAMTEKHNVISEYNMLNLKNELVCAKGIFLSKKHYVIRVIEQEGKTVDETLHTGVETKRSDFPIRTKEFLTDLVNMLIGDKKYNIKEILDFVAIQEIEFENLLRVGDLSLAKSISFGKKLNEYKSIPQNVTAMLNWNDLVYNHFNHGDRGYLFKIKGIDESKAPNDIIEKYNNIFLKKNRKLKVIALPEEETKVPEYFILDVPLMKQFVFTDRYKNMLDPLIEVYNTNRLGLMTI